MLYLLYKLELITLKDNMYTVYNIVVNGVVVYIGHTKDLKKREYQHNYSLNKGKKKELYDYCRLIGVTNLTLIPLQKVKTKVEAKRLEIYLILKATFIGEIGNSIILGETDLRQKIPNISDR